MGFFVDVVTLAKRATALVKAAVTAIRRRVKTVTMFFLKRIAQRIAPFTGSAFFGTVRFVLTKLAYCTLFAQNTAVRGAVGCGLVTGNCAGADLPGNGGRTSAKFLGDRF